METTTTTPPKADRTSSACSAEIAEITREITPKLKRIETLRDEERTLKSQEWIDANGVTLDDIETPDGDDKPWFGDVWTFVEWLKANSSKRFASWNETIYFQSDLKEGKMPRDMSGRMWEIR